MNPLEIFAAGTHTAQSGVTLTFSAADLAATAAAYDPARHEAPLIVGYPELNKPAYGWVKTLAVRNGRMYTVPTQVDPAFAALLNDGRYDRISASFFSPLASSNPVPGVYYLRYIGFLGAAAPAVKGLRKTFFSDGSLNIVTFTSPDFDSELHRAAQETFNSVESVRRAFSTQNEFYRHLQMQRMK